MNWIKSNKRLTCFILALIAGLIILFLIPKCTPVTQTRYSKPIPASKIDSVAKSFVPEKVEPNLIPSEVKVFKKKDKLLRKEAEKKDIILDVKIENNHIVESVIDTAGTVKTLILDVPVKLEEGIKEVAIVPEGVQAKEKTKVGKFLQKAGKHIKTGLIVIGGVTVIVVVAVLAGG